MDMILDFISDKPWFGLVAGPNIKELLVVGAIATKQLLRKPYPSIREGTPYSIAISLEAAVVLSWIALKIREFCNLASIDSKAIPSCCK